MLCVSAKGADPPRRQVDPLSRAADEFKALTGEWGMRPDSPPATQKTGPKLLWHGRVYENFRNDILDAVPHEVTQNRED